MRQKALRSFPNRYLFSLYHKVTSSFSIRYILRIIFSRIEIIFFPYENIFSPVCKFISNRMKLYFTTYGILVFLTKMCTFVHVEDVLLSKQKIKVTKRAEIQTRILAL